MKYPSRGDYETAVRYLDKFVFDSVLRVGEPVKQAQNPNFLLSSNGGNAIVFVIQTNPKKYALKCWVKDLCDLKIRYKAIDDYLKTVKLPYFVDFAYQEQGILVNGQKFPIIRMEWIDGISFRDFISNNIQNPVYIRDFAENFLEMVTSLHQKNISHGDLQHGNIMVQKNNGDICLIDYDSLYVPQLSNEKDNIKGLPGYRHPNRKNLNKLSPKSDYFSELVIYLSLLVISENSHYWTKIEKEERLLFSEEDLERPRLSPIFAELTKLSPEIVYFTLELEKFCQESDIEALQPLEKLVTAYGGSKVIWDFIPNSTPNLSPPPLISIDLNPPAFDVFTKNKPQSSTANVSNSDPWSKLDTNSSSAWDKLDGSQASTKNSWDKLDGSQAPQNHDWDKLGQPDHSKPTGLTIDENIWDKFNHIWNKLLNSVSSIWDKVVNWFN
jgi:serine/threonine protein kinase